MPVRTGKRKIKTKQSQQNHGRDEKSKTESMKELPEQVLRHEILMRLPVKSLLCCKFVCKSWLSMISDPKFAVEHHNRCTMQNPDDYDCLVAHKQSTGLVITSRSKERCVLRKDQYNLMKLIGSINGLVCLRYEHKWWLWNPAIHQSKEFMSPSPRKEEWCGNYWDHFGFGFDPVSNDYKVVVYRDLLYTLRSAFVYSSNSDTWTPLDVPKYDFPTDCVFTSDPSRVPTPSCPSSIVKDCPYWTTFYKRLTGQFQTVTTLKFETRSNKFKLLPEFRCKSGKNAILVDMMDRPTMMDYKQDSQNISVDVYSLDEEGSGVWSKMFSVGPISSSSLKPKILQGFKYGDDIVFHKDGIVSYYDRKTDTISHTPGKYSFVVESCYRYTPSLVFLEGMKVDTPLVPRYESLRSVSSSNYLPC